jgi:hypothetical protein
MTTVLIEAEPLVVKPRTAWLMLNCSHTRGYELLAAGELQSFRDGTSRKILVSSIKEYIARRLTASRDSNLKNPAAAATAARTARRNVRVVSAE